MAFLIEGVVVAGMVLEGILLDKKIYRMNLTLRLEERRSWSVLYVLRR
jgi:hypothetical protein